MFDNTLGMKNCITRNIKELHFPSYAVVLNILPKWSCCFSSMHTLTTAMLNCNFALKCLMPNRDRELGRLSLEIKVRFIIIM